MSLYVLKFGGSSVATTARIDHVAGIISEFVDKGHSIVVVTSAMQGVTNQLIELTKAFSDSPMSREYDAIISSGEHVAAGLLALALNSRNISAKSLTAWQVPIEVSGVYSDASIVHVGVQKILDLLKCSIVPVITGFQGISANGDVCTIGRGGSDATACAVANAIRADECLIYTDVDGVYTADPRVVLDARKLDEISYDDMIELSSWGAKVLQTKSTQIAKEYNVNLRVLSSFSEGYGTKITKYIANNRIVGIAYNLDLFAVYSSKKGILPELMPYISMIKRFSDGYLIPKTMQAEIQSSLTLQTENSEISVDNNIGTVTIVGKTKIDKTQIHEIEHVIETEYSQTFIVPFQQTLPLVTKLHEMFFSKN